MVRRLPSRQRWRNARMPHQASLPPGTDALSVGKMGAYTGAEAVMDDDQKERPESLLPYEKWIEQALRQVVALAIDHAASEGLPGGHHFYITFRTDFPGVVVPPRIRAQYPREMTIVLQHQFWDLRFDREAQAISVGLSFGGVSTTLTIPLASVVEFADPHVRY